MTGLLITLIIILFFVVIFQVARTSELLGILKGEREGHPSEDANRINGFLFLVLLLVGLVAAIWSAITQKSKYLPESSSAHGGMIDSMFNITLFFTGLVFVITQVALFWFAFRYRHRKGQMAYYYPENNKLEMLWTIIPAIVLTVLVVMGINAWYKIMGPAPEDAMVVEVTGQQFSWLVRYPGKDAKLGQREFELISGENTLGINFEDPNSHDDVLPTEIHLPVNKPVLFKLGAKDVLHSFYLPHFRVKMDCVPGIPTQFWMTPTVTTAEMREKLNDPNFDYVLACAELCGSAHWNMKLTVVVESEEDYNKWLAQQKPIYESFVNMAERTPETELLPHQNQPKILSSLN